MINETVLLDRIVYLNAYIKRLKRNLKYKNTRIKNLKKELEKYKNP